MTDSRDNKLLGAVTALMGVSVVGLLLGDNWGIAGAALLIVTIVATGVLIGMSATQPKHKS